MILGVPKEILDNETRVAAIPATVKQYVSAGFEVKVQSGAGAASQELRFPPKRPLDCGTPI